MKSMGGALGLAALALVLGGCGGAFWIFQYIDTHMGSEGVFAALGLLVGVPFILIVVIVLGLFGLAYAKIFSGAMQSNDGALQSMFETFGKMSLLLKHQRGGQGALPDQAGQWIVEEPGRPDPVALLGPAQGWNTNDRPQIGSNFLIEK